MTFLWPELLWLIAALPLLIGAYWLLLRRKQKRVLAYASLAGMREAMGPARAPAHPAGAVSDRAGADGARHAPRWR